MRYSEPVADGVDRTDVPYDDLFRKAQDRHPAVIRVYFPLWFIEQAVARWWDRTVLEDAHGPSSSPDRAGRGGWGARGLPEATT